MKVKIVNIFSKTEEGKSIGYGPDGLFWGRLT